MIVHNGGPVQSIHEAVLFPFDDYSIPLHKNLLMDLIPARKLRTRPAMDSIPIIPESPWSFGVGRMTRIPRR